jgi:subtilisin family serine protease
LSTLGLTTAITAALSAGIIVCCASGNTNIGNIVHPANVSGVICVGAIDSSVLPETVNIFSSYIMPDGTIQMTNIFHNLGGAEVRVGGTSQATHMTSAMMALYKQKYPTLNSAKGINLLRRKALKIDSHTYNMLSSTKDTLLDYQTGAGFTSPLY